MRTQPLKLIEIPSSQGSGNRFFAQVPGGMQIDHAVTLVNAIIKRANGLYAQPNGDHDIGAVYDMIARDLATAGFSLEARLEVRASTEWDRTGDLSSHEQRLVSELDRRHAAPESSMVAVAA